MALRLPNGIKFTNNDTDSIDLALIQIKDKRFKEIKSHFSFLLYGNLGFDHIFDEDLSYMLFGFINKKTLKSYEFTVESFGFLTNFRSYKKIEKLSFNYNNNITLEYNRRKQGDFDDDIPRFGFKDLKGLSGGGIWLSVEGKKPDTYNYILVGIMIEERIDRGFVIGIKISLIQKEVNLLPKI